MKRNLSKEIRQSAEQQARLGKVFSNPHRVLILWLLADAEKTVSELADAIGASRPRTSQHLLMMRLNHIVESHRVLKHTYYRITDNELLGECLILINKPKGKCMYKTSQP